MLLSLLFFVLVKKGTPATCQQQWCSLSFVMCMLTQVFYVNYSAFSAAAAAASVANVCFSYILKNG